MSGQRTARAATMAGASLGAATATAAGQMAKALVEGRAEMLNIQQQHIEETLKTVPPHKREVLRRKMERRAKEKADGTVGFFLMFGIVIVLGVQLFFA